MFDSITGIRIANEALAASLRKMKFEERRHRDCARWQLNDNRYSRPKVVEARVSLSQRHQIYVHRKRVIEPAMRASYLAYAFLRGMPLRRVENAALSRPKWDMVTELILRHSGKDDERVVRQRLAEWIDEAKLLSTIAPRPPEKPRPDDEGLGKSPAPDDEYDAVRAGFIKQAKGL